MVATVGGGYGGVGANYNFESHTTRGSVTIEVDTWVNAYIDGVSSRQYNGYGPADGGAMFKVVDFIGTVAAGWQTADNHDIGYGKPGANKAAVDYGLFTNMVSGSISNISQRNGLVRAGIGLAISPLYYGAVAIGGNSAFNAAQGH